MTVEHNKLFGPDLVLILLGAPTIHTSSQNRINGITRLEKLLFLANEEEDIQRTVQDKLEFVPYHYGPYSRDVYEAVDLLDEASLLREERRVDLHTADGAEEVVAGIAEERAVERCFLLTSNGISVARLLGNRHPDVWLSLSRIKDIYAHLPLQALFRYVYRTFPIYTERSRIRERFL